MPTNKPQARQHAQVSFSPTQQASLELDRRVLRDLGLQMPRITLKYWLAVQLLSDLDSTSPYFYHVYAARYGQRALYQSLIQRGYTWKDGQWQQTVRKSK